MSLKNFVRFSIFTIVFVLTIVLLSEIYTNKGQGFKLKQFYNEPVNSFDVLMFGPCYIDNMLLPPVLWNEAGITSYNLAIGASPAAAQYYWLKEALKYQSPSLVALSGRYLFGEDINFDRREARYRQALDQMRWSRNKIESIMEVLSHSERQRFLDYVFPLLRFHTRERLYAIDFDFFMPGQRHVYFSGHPNFYARIRPQARPEAFDDNSHDPPFHITGKYLTKMIELCKGRNIDVVLIAPPYYNDDDSWSINMHNALQNYADEHGVSLIDFNYGEPRHEAALDDSIDFRHVHILNISGGTKASRYFARYISEKFNLPDRRTKPYDPHWDKQVDYYNEYYNVRFARELSRIQQGEEPEDEEFDELDGFD